MLISLLAGSAGALQANQANSPSSAQGEEAPRISIGSLESMICTWLSIIGPPKHCLFINLFNKICTVNLLWAGTI